MLDWLLPLNPHTDLWGSCYFLLLLVLVVTVSTLTDEETEAHRVKLLPEATQMPSHEAMVWLHFGPWAQTAPSTSLGSPVLQPTFSSFGVPRGAAGPYPKETWKVWLWDRQTVRGDTCNPIAGARLACGHTLGWTGLRWVSQEGEGWEK